MLFYLYDTNFKLLKTIDAYESAIWTTRFFKPGDFQIRIPLKKLTTDFQKNYFIRRSDRKNVGIIEKIEKEDNLDKKIEYVRISGRFASCLWEWRVNNAYLLYNNLSIDAITNNLYVNHFTTGNRKLPQFNYIRTNAFDDKITSLEDTGTNCLTLIEKVFLNLKMGFTEEIKDGKILFSMFEGVDRSKSQTKNKRIVFSSEFDNLTNSKYTTSYEAYRNTAYVAVKNDGNQLTIKKIKEIGAGSGINRKETFVFGSDITEEQTEEEWENVLNELGKNSLIDITEEFNGDIVPEVKYRFSPDKSDGSYWVGDIVTVENKKLNAFMNVRIYEAIESKEGKNETLILTFGNSEVIEND